MNANIIIVGVGGQGILLTSKILGRLALQMGEDVKVSEVHGMAQRGGSVITHVRIGSEVRSPLIAEHEADFVISFEYLEALRAEYYLKNDGVLIVNTQKIIPMPIINGAAVYPDTALAAKTVKALDALALAEKCHNARAVNIVLMGVLARFMPAWPQEAWEKAIADSVPQKTPEGNIAAFRAGLEA